MATGNRISYAEYIKECTVVIRNLNWGTTDQKIEEIFKQHGTVLIYKHKPYNTSKINKQTQQIDCTYVLAG